jgi:hypothetical protein
LCNGNTWFWADCTAQSNRQKRVYELGNQPRETQRAAEQAKANAGASRTQRQPTQAAAEKRLASSLTKRSRTLATSLRKTEVLVAHHERDSIRPYERSHAG